eukprot:1174058-Pyramimonas_sp.AAC.1
MPPLKPQTPSEGTARPSAWKAPGDNLDASAVHGLSPARRLRGPHGAGAEKQPDSRASLRNQGWVGGKLIADSRQRPFTNDVDSLSSSHSGQNHRLCKIASPICPRK